MNLDQFEESDSESDVTPPAKEATSRGADRASAAKNMLRTMVLLDQFSDDSSDDEPPTADVKVKAASNMEAEATPAKQEFGEAIALSCQSTSEGESDSAAFEQRTSETQSSDGSSDIEREPLEARRQTYQAASPMKDLDTEAEAEAIALAAAEADAESEAVDKSAAPLGNFFQPKKCKKKAPKLERRTDQPARPSKPVDTGPAPSESESAEEKSGVHVNKAAVLKPKVENDEATPMVEQKSEETIASLPWRAQPDRRHERRSTRQEKLKDERRSTKEKLTVSEDSWAARQRARRSAQEADVSDDAEIARRIKSILNKLTIEKFGALYTQLISCGISSATHVELLVHEVFEKASTQHHFIDMYTDLCMQLHEHFIENPIGTDPKGTAFKKILLNECQVSFEGNLAPPADLKALSGEDRTIAETKYKRRMIGTIKFVGALLTRRMLASKVLMALIEELLSDPTPEAVESLAALLTVVGPVFDKPDWPYHLALKASFERVKDLTKQKSIEPRARCLLKDVLDLRSAGWISHKAKTIEGPKTLAAVAEEASPPKPAAKELPGADGWTQIGTHSKKSSRKA
eukprot:gnl/TRDRNA2_/TRDRNA2_152016_c0_seq1.p1 gnl/TRDRNA2_/TRDRNA2_152016_c0~~gnl/TRDRNA2_/TRDRNA2_152016_c0_seq1.p1  ORF type:complete len:674 (-),score=152.83 gnl/TRDRNA2_/TRDRNA2_152016_c0_seq1:167-1894(-)